MATFSGRGIQVCAHNDYSSVQVSNCPGGVFDLKMGLSSSNFAILIEKTEQLTQQTCWSGPCDLMVWCGMMCFQLKFFCVIPGSCCLLQFMAGCLPSQQHVLKRPANLALAQRWFDGLSRKMKQEASCVGQLEKDENGWTSNWKGE